MSLYRYQIERAVFFRVPGIKKINSIESGLGRITLFIGDENGNATKEIIDLARQVVEKNRPLGIQVIIEPFCNSPFLNKGLYELPEHIKRAHIFSATHSDIEFLVKSCIPNCVYFDSITVSGGVIDVYIADKNFEADNEMIEKAKSVLKELFPSDISISVYKFEEKMLDSIEERRKNFFIQTSRFDVLDYEDDHIKDVAKRDEERFGDTLGKLINGEIKYTSIIDNRLPKGGTIYVDPFITEQQLSILLTLYSKVFYPILPDKNNSYKTLSSLPIDLILALARKGKLIPIFRNPLHKYKPSTVRKFLEDKNINVILPRQLDGLTILTLANQFPFWKTFRENPQVAAEVSYNVSLINKKLLEKNPTQTLLVNALTETTDIHIQVAESGEAWFMDKGHIAAGSITAGGAVQSLISYLRDKLSSEVSDTIFIESHMYSTQLSIARALGAVFYPSIVRNEKILNLVSHLHAGPDTNFLVPKIDEMGVVLKNLKIICPENVSILDYIDVLNDFEVKKLRNIITEMVNQSSGSHEKLLEQVEVVNNEIRKWNKSRGRFIQENLDILGLGLEIALLPTGLTAPPLTTSFVGIILKALLGERIEDIEDRIYAKIGGVSPAALRIQRIRSNIQKLE
jgi:hypothetical protein